MMIALGLLILRLVLGLIFMGHGSQKLFGAFGGHGLVGTRQIMENLGLRPTTFWATIAALGEFVGGLLLVLGLFMPLGALIVIGVMLTAIAKVHWRKGFWNSQGGYEFNLALTAMAVAPGFMGAGAWSLDAVFGFSAPEPLTFLIGLLVLVVLLLVTIPLAAAAEHRSGSLLHRPGHP